MHTTRVTTDDPAENAVIKSIEIHNRPYCRRGIGPRNGYICTECDEFVADFLRTIM